MTGSDLLLKSSIMIYLQRENTARAKASAGVVSPAEDKEPDRPKKKGEGKVAAHIDEEGIHKKPRTDPIKVLLVDDHQMVREALCYIVEQEDDMQVIAEAENGIEAVRLVDEIQPQIVVMDINMPEMDGIDASHKIMKKYSSLRIIGLSIHDRKSVEKAILKAGAHLYLTKDEAVKTLCKSIRSEYAKLD